jgi:hypothetical protein
MRRICLFIIATMTVIVSAPLPAHALRSSVEKSKADENAVIHHNLMALIQMNQQMNQQIPANRPLQNSALNKSRKSSPRSIVK